MMVWFSTARYASLSLGSVLLPVLLLAAPLNAAEQQPGQANTPRDWLARMSDAVKQQHYEGTFVYFHDDKLEAMRLVHRADKTGGAERLVSLSGEPREIIRQGDVVKCFLPGREAVIVERGETAMPLPAAGSLQDPTLQKHYEFLDMGQSRVAGRSCKIIGIKPRDDFRYGYRLCLDMKTALPLKSELMSQDGEVIEQVMFTTLNLPDKIPGKALQAQIAADNFTWHVRHDENVSPKPLSGSGKNNKATPVWQADKLPDGFVMTRNSMERNKTAPRDPSAYSWHIVYSDGLASVSVFVEPANTAQKTLDGATHLGAVNAFGRQLENWQITVVGEVPAKTVKLIAKSLQSTEAQKSAEGSLKPEA